MAHDPRQTIIEFLSAPVASSSSTLVVVGDDMRQKGTRRTSGGFGAVATTIQFLKEREVEHFYACIVAFEDQKGQIWEMVCLAQQDAQGNWVLRNGRGGAPHSHLAKPMIESNSQPVGAELKSGLGTEGGFFAGGYLVGSDVQNVTRVRLIDQNGVTLEDVVAEKDDGRVLFVTENAMEMPVRVEIT